MGSKKIKLKNKNLKFLIKNVPYYSQYLDTFVVDNKNKYHPDIIDGYWFKRACGIASLKMVIDYFRKAYKRKGCKYKKMPIMKLIWQGIKIGAFLPRVGGWYHQGLIDIVKKYGFCGKCFDWSNKNKKINRIKKEKALKKIAKIIRNKNPLIASIYKNFIPNNSGHLIVLVGFKESNQGVIEGFYYNDPQSFNRKSKKYAFIDKNKFLNGWKGRIIFIWPKKIKK